MLDAEDELGIAVVVAGASVVVIVVVAAVVVVVEAVKDVGNLVVSSSEFELQVMNPGVELFSVVSGSVVFLTSEEVVFNVVVVVVVVVGAVVVEEVVVVGTDVVGINFSVVVIFSVVVFNVVDSLIGLTVVFIGSAGFLVNVAVVGGFEGLEGLTKVEFVEEGLKVVEIGFFKGLLVVEGLLVAGLDVVGFRVVVFSVVVFRVVGLGDDEGVVAFRGGNLVPGGFRSVVVDVKGLLVVCKVIGA